MDKKTLPGRRVKSILLAFVLFSLAIVNAQQIQNVKFTASGKQIIITYDITGAQSGQTFDVSVFCSTDGGKTPGSQLSSVSGDAGPGVTGGTGKRVTWDVLSDRDNLVGSILFEVQAKPSYTGTSQVRRNEQSQTSSDPYWVSIPGGTFMMGSPTSEPGRSPAGETQRQVTISPFKMGKYEVTFAEYDEFCAATRRRKPDDDGWGRGNRPVMNINWMDAKAFADWKGFRLPTEAEWEYACRAGSDSPFSTGDRLATDQANFNGEKEPYNGASAGKFLGKTQPVGSYAPNGFGLYDMHGNVSEWVSDWYSDSYTSAAQTDPRGPDTGRDRIRRGGSWYDPAVRCRSAFRMRMAPDRIDRIIGLRLVSDK